MISGLPGGFNAQNLFGQAQDVSQNNTVLPKDTLDTPSEPVSGGKSGEMREEAIQFNIIHNFASKVDTTV